MKKNLLVASVLSTAIIFAAVPPAIAASVPESTQNSGKLTTITDTDASYAALDFLVNRRHKIHEKSDWYQKSITISKITPLISPDDKSNQGYLIEFKSNGKPNGFAVVSSNPNENGVIAYDEIGAPNLPGKIKPTDNYTYIPGVGICLVTSDDQGPILQLPSHNRVHIKDWKKTSIPDNKTNQQKWKFIQSLYSAGSSSTEPANGVTSSDPTNWITDQTLLTGQWILNVPTELQSWYTWTSGGVTEYPGCSPTSGAMIMEWWYNHGGGSSGAFAKLYPSTAQNLIFALRSTMGTIQYPDGNGDTSPSNVGSGLLTYASNQGFQNSSSSTSYFFSSMTSEIDQGRPTELSFNQPYYGGHSTVATAYEIWSGGGNEGSQWIGMNDTINYGTMWMDYSTISYGTWAYQSTSFIPSN